MVSHELVIGLVVHSKSLFKMNFSTVLLVTSCSALVGISLWAALWYRNRRLAWSLQQLILMTFVIGLACRLTFVLFTPTFYAPDEEPHFNYIKYLHEHHAFPVQTSKTGGPTKDWEYYQPPLYYLASVPVYQLIAHLVDSQRHFFFTRAIRLLSILYWAINVLLAWQILKNLKLNDPFIRLFVVGMVCLLPTYTFLSASINNDNLVITMGGAILWLLSSKEVSDRKSLSIGILLGVALLTKLTAIVYIPAIAGIFAVQVIRKSWPLSTAVFRFLLIGVIAGIFFSPWALRNIKVYGEIYPEGVANVLAHWNSTYEAFIIIQGNIQDTFWSTSGIYNNILFLPQVGVFLTYLALIGLGCGFLSKTKPLRDYWQGEPGSFLGGTGLAIGVNLFLALRFGMLYDQGQGRFLFPLLIPIAIFLALGLQSLGLQKYSKELPLHTLGFFAVYLFAFVTYSLGLFVEIWL